VFSTEQAEMLNEEVKKVELEELNDENLDKIRKTLPEQPWSKGIHKKVAKDIGLPVFTVQQGIAELIKRGEYQVQFGGKLMGYYESDGASGDKQATTEP